MLKKWLVISALIFGFVAAAHSAIDVYEFDNDEQRKRYQTFIQELRCPKCKNQNLAGTNSQIAIDLRRELHRMVMEGQSDEQIIDFMVSRYGDFVLYRPPIKGNTLILWLGPVFFLIIGGGCIGWIVMRRRKFVNASEELSEVEKNQLAAMLSTSDSSDNRKKD